MKIELQNVRGTKDFLPEEQIVRNKIINILKQNFEAYGYMPLETPMLNMFDLLSYKYDEGAEILSEIYRLKDQGRRDLGLRFDLTVPFCKVIGLNKELTMPFRRYEIGKVFRDGPVKLGRAREFYQCDIDVVGIDGRYIEAEQMLLVKNVFNQLEIPITIKWNNRKLMTGLLEYAGVGSNQIDVAIGLIDRLAKISKEELFQEFANEGINEEMVNNIMQLFSKTLPEYVEQFSQVQNTNIQEGLSEICELKNLLQELQLDSICQFSPTLARGLSIYTGTVFEFFDSLGRITSSLGGGGRYDRIITDFMDNGQNYPAVGLCFGLEPIYAILSKTQNEPFVDVFVVPMGTQVECLKLATSLRQNGIKTIVELGNKKVKKAFEYANKTGIKYVVVVGSNELESGLFALKNMQTGEQINASLEQIIQIVKN